MSKIEMNPTNFKKIRDLVKQHFEIQKTGEQVLYTDQTNLFKPLIDTSKESAKILSKKIMKGQEELSNALQPFTSELRRRNEFIDLSQSLPHYIDVPEERSTPKKTIYVDVDKDFDENERELLATLDLPLPSDVHEDSYLGVMRAVRRQNQKIGQYLGKRSKKTEVEKEDFRIQQELLSKYKEVLRSVVGVRRFVLGTGFKLVRPKRKRGRPRTRPDVIRYNSPDDLVQELHSHLIARKAGNTGLDNYIISILDELLDTKIITKDEYDKIYKRTFFPGK